VTNQKDLNREIIRTEYSSIAIPELELEVPLKADRKGEITTLESVLRGVSSSPQDMQPLRRVFNSPFFLNFIAWNSLDSRA
jgi:zinc finger protein